MKSLLENTDGVVAPGVFDPLTALLAEQAGFDTVYVSGASLAYTQLGRPDLGFLSLSQVGDAVARIKQRTNVHIVVDADTGFGNALNTMHTVRLLELAGASAIQLEDQKMPKRCGHLKGKSLVSTGEMVNKITAAIDARQSADTAIMARTDAIAVSGFDAAIERAEAYLAAGADILFIEAPQSLQQMQMIAERFAQRVPLLANMVEGGKTPITSAQELHDLGFKLVITPGSLARTMAFAAARLLTSLKAEGSTASVRSQMFSFDELNERVGLPETLELGSRYGSSDTDGEAGGN